MDAFIQHVNTGELRRTGLCRPLHHFIRESSDAFAGDGGEREGVLSVCLQTFQGVGGSWREGQFLLRDNSRRREREAR